MTQEQKELLLKDLCARLPYGIKAEIKYYDDAWELLAIYTNGTTYAARDIGYPIETWFYDCKPYLFPLSSMTDKQIMESPISIQVCDLENLRYDSVWTELNDRFPDLIDLIDWLNKNHFDYRGLIPMGLAIDATGLNIY